MIFSPEKVIHALRGSEQDKPRTPKAERLAPAWNKAVANHARRRWNGDA
jgi:hypothetical protein